MATEPLAQARARFAEREILLTDEVKKPEVADEVEGEGATVREYHPWISRAGGRKFVLALIGMLLVLATTVFVSFRYDPLNAEVIQLVDTNARWIAAIVALFVGGNAARFVSGLFGRPGDSK